MATARYGKQELPRADWREDAQQLKWVPRGWPLVAPQSDAQVSVAEPHLGFTSRWLLSRGRGRDFAVILDEMRQEHAMAAKAGVEINGVSVAAKPAAADPDAPSGRARQGDPSADGTVAADGKPARRSGGQLRGPPNGAGR